MRTLSLMADGLSALANSMALLLPQEITIALPRPYRRPRALPRGSENWVEHEICSEAAPEPVAPRKATVGPVDDQVWVDFLLTEDAAAPRQKIAGEPSLCGAMRKWEQQCVVAGEPAVVPARGYRKTRLAHPQRLSGRRSARRVA